MPLHCFSLLHTPRPIATNEIHSLHDLKILLQLTGMGLHPKNLNLIILIFMKLLI